VRPSISTGSVIAGSGVLVTVIVPVTPNVIVSGPEAAFAEAIAARSDPGPESFVFVTGKAVACAAAAKIQNAANIGTTAKRRMPHLLAMSSPDAALAHRSGDSSLEGSPRVF